jgi:DNA-directed RNA polymerase II subunit RPB9
MPKTAKSSFAIRFCEECHNMLYPKEDKTNKMLLYACRNCDHQEESESSLVYRHELVQLSDERTQVFKDLASDPTLPRTKNVSCIQCRNDEAVFFQAHSGRSDQPMTLYFVCTNPQCGFRWED